MLLKLENVLNQSEVAEVRRIVEAAKFIDGAVSGKATLKKNLQAARGTEEFGTAIQKVIGALMARQEFKDYAVPKQITMEFNRYDPGMFYKNHMDAPLMGGLRSQPIRSDLSFSVFLTDPRTYDGGEFVLQSPYGEQRVKGEAGDAIVYPSSMIHRVDPVQSGSRWGAVGWIQSMLRSQAQREIHYEVSLLREMAVEALPDSELQERFDHLQGNLIRMWAEV
ncbi:MAG: Fe2+-dependent dioxygenase [Alphaproteobacteria bacterium]